MTGEFVTYRRPADISPAAWAAIAADAHTVIEHQVERVRSGHTPTDITDALERQS